MPWREVSKMDQRREFVALAKQEGVNRRELCRQFGIHPDTGYKWLGRFASDGELADRSRRPHSSPVRTEQAIEARILALRDEHPAWGGASLCAVSSARDCDLLHSPPCMRFYAGTGASSCRQEELWPRKGSKSRHPTCSGRWTSKAGCGLATAAAAIP